MLKIQWETFCQEYVKGKNASKAYCIAYGKDFNDKKAYRVATRQASSLLSKPDIQARIKEINQLILNANIADARELQERLTKIARININATSNPKQVEAVIKSIDVLAKLQGLYIKQESGNVNITVNVDGVDVDEEFEP